jgi:hypothetical protein
MFGPAMYRQGPFVTSKEEHPNSLPQKYLFFVEFPIR